MEHANLSYLDELAGEDQEFRQQFIDILKNEFPEEKATYLDLLHKNEFIEASLMVHKLKHKINILSLKEGYKLAATHETQLKEGNTSLSSQFFRILESIDVFLKSL